VREPKVQGAVKAIAVVLVATLCILAVTFSVRAETGVAAAAGGAPVSDDFNLSSINTSLWTLYNPEGNATVSDNGSAAVLSVPGGPGEDAWTPEQSPALFQSVSNSNFSVEAEFTSEVTSVSQEQGILAFGDSTDFIRYDVHTWGSSTYIYAQATIAGTPTEIFNNAITNGPDIYMRLSRSSNTWSFSYSLNGTSYTTEPSYTQALTMTEIGPYAGNSGTTASNAPAFTSDINYFHNIASSEPVITSVASSSLTASGATVTWTTDEASTSVVNYGGSTSYGSTATGASSVTSHSVTLSGLSCGTTYDYDVSSTDGSGNTDTSGNETFMTSACSGGGAPVSDDFNLSSINTSLWTLYNPEGNATVSDNGSAAVLSVPGGPGEDAWTPELAPALFQSVSNSNFSVEAEFTSEVTSVSQEQGILAFGDSTDFIRYDVHTWGSSTYIYAQATIAGTPTEIFNNAITNGPDIYMRLSRSSNTWSFSYSLNGTSYTTEPSYTQALTMTEIGPYAGNSGTTASNAPAFTSDINYFHNIASSEPVITSVASSSLTASGATVTWTTDEASTSVVNYGGSTSYGSTATGASSVTSHSVTLSGLSCGTTYDYDVSSTDGSGNTDTSGNETFMTSACSGGGAPVSDDFNLSSINTSLWTLYNPEGNATVSDNGSAAVLSVPGGPGEDAWTPELAPALFQSVSNSNFSVEAEFTSEVTSVSQEQGILAFGDSTDFIRYDVHTWGSSTYIYAQATIAGTPTEIFNNAITNGPDIYMRLSRSSNTWSFSYSLNGTSYTTEPSYTQALTMTEIGPYAGNSGTTASNAPAFTSDINYFHNIASSEPVITSVASSSLTASGATVTWTTDEASTSVVNYGGSTSYGSTATGASSVTSHSVTLSGLSCGTTYDYDVSSTDGSGNTDTSGNETFMTSACSGGGAPVSDDFNLSSINTSLWTLYNPEGNATVSDNGSAAVLSVPGGPGEDAWTPELAPALFQSVSNSNFSVEAEFTSEVTSVSQEQGILAFGDSTDFIRYDVHTWGSSTYIYAQATIAGTPTEIFNNAITNGPDIYMRLSRSSNTWSFSYSLNGTSYTTEPSYTQALTMTEIGPYAGNSGTTASNAPAFTSDINYFHNIASSEPVITSVASSSLTASGATVTWTTDEASTSVVNYGGSTSYGSTATGASSVTSHSVTLSGLSCGTTYDYDVSSTDGSGNTDTSGNETFMTSACSVGGAPVSDDFNLSSINTSLWTLYNPEGNATVSDNGSAAVLSVPGGPGEDAWTPEQSPALFQSVSNSNFSVEAEFTSEVTSVTQEQGILAYEDPSDFIRVNVQSTAYTSYGGATSAEIYAQATLNGTATQLFKTPVSNGADFYLRVSRSGNNWTVSYSYDGLRWTPAGSFTQAFTMTEIGPYAGNSGTTASNAPAFTATINYFHNIAGVDYTTPPAINLWYGNNETFGENGEPQTAVNVLGDVEDVAGMSSLSYTLNGGSSQPLEMGENMYRLTAPGEFNIEIPYSSLSQGPNTVVITATDLAGNISTQSVTVNDDYTGQSWPANYSVNWSTAANINSVAQVVDGNWAIEPNGTVENLDSGYDRLIDLGDMTTWQNYEATVQVTIDSLPANGGPFDIGPIMGWQGHTNYGDGQQPPDGHPFDAAFAYGNDTGNQDALEIYANSPNHHESILAKDTSPNPMQLTVRTTYTFEIEATLNSGGTTSEYSFKVWQTGTTEPSTWNLQAAGDPNQGSLLLWEYGYGATVSYGPVTVTSPPA
jgi:hypothetical protein